MILLAGLQGSGKTTTAAKLARHLRDELGRKPLLVAADIQRPAAVEQLRTLGEQIDVPVPTCRAPAPTPVELAAGALGRGPQAGLTRS